MKKLLLAFIILISFCIPCYGQNDQLINGRNINVTFDTNQAWSSLSSRTYLMAPLGPDYGFCVSIINNNTTSAHSFSVAAFQTGDNNVADYSHNTGRYATLAIVGNPSPIAANTTQTFFVRSNGAAKLAFQFTGASTQAGSPDTVDIFAVQTTAAGCGTVNPQTGQSYTLATPNTGTSASPPLMAVADGLSQGFSSFETVTNPVATQMIMHVAGLSTTKNIYFQRMVISSTAAGEFLIGETSNAGSSCSAGTQAPVNTKGGNLTAAVATETKGTCVSNPATVQSMRVLLGANQPFTFDLTGFISPTGTNSGIDIITPAGITGTIDVFILWYEK